MAGMQMKTGTSGAGSPVKTVIFEAMPSCNTTAISSLCMSCMGPIFFLRILNGKIGRKATENISCTTPSKWSLIGLGRETPA